MAAAVDFILLDTQPTPQPLSGVSISIYHPTTRAFLASGVTGTSGYAAFSLPGSVDPGTEYEARFYKAGVRFVNPRLFRVIEPAVPTTLNQFEVQGEATLLPGSSDPFCCKCTGKFFDFSNRPVANTRVRVSQIVEDPTPEVVGGNLVVTQRMEFATDREGVVSFDLLRGGIYYVTFSGEEERTFKIFVPDRASVNLVDLIFPSPTTLTWDSDAAPLNQVTLSVGDTYTIPVTVGLSDYTTRTKSVGFWFDAIIADSNVVSARIIDSALELTAKAEGNTTIGVVPHPSIRPIRSPAPVISFSPLSVVVSP